MPEQNRDPSAKLKFNFCGHKLLHRSPILQVINYIYYFTVFIVSAVQCDLQDEDTTLTGLDKMYNTNSQSVVVSYTYLICETKPT